MDLVRLWNRSTFICVIVVFGAIQIVPRQAASGELEIVVVDHNGDKLACRMLVRPNGGACISPQESVKLTIGPDQWFMSAGRCKLEVPEGTVTIRAEHGPEFRRFKERVKVSGNRTVKRITLKRWIDLRRQGYACGENHLHMDSRQLAPMLVCEGLDFGSSLTWFNGPDGRRPIPPGSGKLRLLEFAGHKVPTTVYDAELEYAWGAAYIQNLSQPLPLASQRGRPNLDYLKHAVESGAIVHYQAGWSREVSVDALLGLVHTVNVCNNNFHLHRYQQRSHYSNLLNVEGFPTYPDTEAGMMQMNTDTYYRLLNWGLKLAAGAGSATGVKQVPVGYNRAYVRVGAEASLDDFYKNWAAGRNFVTNGPMLLLSTLRGKRPGDSLRFPDSGGKVQLQVRAMCGPDQELQSIEIIVNGNVASSARIDDPHSVTDQIELDIEQGSWVAARCTARDKLLSNQELAVYSQGADKDRYRMRPSRLRFAHTSPIYISVGGEFAAIPRSLNEGMLMLQQFEDFASTNATPEHRPNILSSVTEARRKLATRLSEVQALPAGIDNSRLAAADASSSTPDERLFVARPFTKPNEFTQGIEGPACDAAGNVYAVNFGEQATIGRVSPHGRGAVFVRLPAGSVGNGIRFNRTGMMYVADYIHHNVLMINPRTREISVFAHDGRMNQPNDLAIGPDGVLYASDPNWGNGTGQLWRVDTTGSVTRLADQMGTTNGIEVSPDGHTLYVNESVQRNVWAFTLSERGTLTNKRLLKKFVDHGFDGMRCDVDGNLYITRYGKGTVVKLSPDGNVLREIDILGQRPSNICFGGPDGRTAYVTEVEHQRLVSFRVDRPGLAWQRWRQK